MSAHPVSLVGSARLRRRKRAWTDADIASLKHLAGKMAATQIAAELGRTYTGADHQGFQAEASAAPELQGRLIDHLLGPYNCIIIVGAYEAAMSANFAGVIDGHNACFMGFDPLQRAVKRSIIALRRRHAGPGPQCPVNTNLRINA
jgi:hypothetical protein